MLNHVRAALRVTIAATVLVVASAHAAPPSDLDRYVKRVFDTFETPGMAITIVERDKAPVVRTYGVRRMGEAAKVDGQTMFSMGSTTKAFTSAVLAMLVDEGKLSWDSKVVDLLPGFRMYDPYTSSEMTVRDLLVHRSGLGLGAGDLMFVPETTLTRAQIVEKLRYIKPATSFRSGYAYDNMLYVVAGQLIEAVCKDTWENVVRQRILAPLQMEHTTTSSTTPPGANKGWPHGRVSTELRGVGPMTPLPKQMSFDNSAPAGSLNASIADVARWLELQLGRGLDPRTNVRLFSEAQSREMWTGQTLIPVAQNPKPLELAQANFRAYALGWGYSDYRGQPIVSHGGGVLGSVALVVIVPGKDVAFAMMTNSEETSALAAVQYRLLDHYLGLSSPDWIGALNDVRKARIAKGQEILAAAATTAPAQGGKGPSLSLEKYAGSYRDDWYGGVTIENGGDGLSIRFEHTPAFSGKLEHVQYDTFRTRWTDRTLTEDAYVTFSLQPDGSIATMTMKAISPLADFSFDFQDLLFKPVRTVTAASK
ncbi:serine hydrolase [Steroidobacter agaridevorans]|uniref:Serine hydrolase n=1 Tax=Steroidobacter agaridevorans TaxID=2695856 RepID=A0A829YLM6_9GAMM|nr:serine hydrolase [Steroidobacter agaridevorans]GFE84205.1 serine hydrolase [Steroidobacter agaridevorans]